MPVAFAPDGYRLWYEAAGDGPAIVFPVRFRAETAALGGALAAHHRIVRYKPREAVGVMEPEGEAGGPWGPSGHTRYPVETETGDLHAVADAAGVAEFVLAGYSGMAALAAFLVPVTERAAGLMIGGFPLLAGCDYWLGFMEGARAALLQAGLPEKAAEHHLGRLLYREWAQRDDRSALAALPGPKILWYGTRDCEPDCQMHDFVGGAAIARRIAAQTGDLRGTGFDVIAFDGYDHIEALASTEAVAPRLSAALATAGW